MLVMLVTSAMFMSGCNTADVIPDETLNDLSTRMQLNTDGVNLMHQYGFIDDEGHQIMLKNVDTLNKTINSALNGSTNDLKNITKAIRIVAEDTKLTPYLTPDATGYMGFSEESQKQVQDLVDVQLMVLKEMQTETQLEDIMKAVDSYIQAPKTQANFNSSIGQYVEDAYDEKGNPIKIKLPPVFKMTETGSGLSNSNKLGLDFVVKSYSTTQADENGEYHVVVPAATLRLFELNPDFLDVVMGLNDGSEPNYLVYREGDGVKLILMNYPVSHLSRVIEDPDVEGGYCSEFKASEIMYVNLKSGNLKKKISDTEYKDIDQKQGIIYMVDDDDIHFMSSYNAQNTVTDANLNGSSFVAKGKVKTNINVKLVLDENKTAEQGGTLGDDYKDVMCGQILLRDYMETVYMPNITSDPWVITGRKIRLVKFSGKPREVWGKYVDNAGKVYDDTYMPDFLLTDLVGGTSGEDGNDYFFKIRPDESYPTGVGGDDSGGAVGNDEDGDGRIDDSVIQASLPKYYCDNMYADKEIPSEELMSSDFGDEIKTDDRLIMYAFKTDKNMFDTKLYSGYVESPDTKNNLAWWNTWLTNNQYNYQVNIGDITKHFTGTYGYDILEDGYIAFDGVTIEKLQNDLNTEKAVQYASILRAIFICLGVVLMFYGLIILCAWVFDTNFVMGPKILTIMTFGKWVAVTTKSDDYDIGERKMMTFRDVLVRSIVITLIGTTVALFDAIAVITMLITKLSSFVEVLQDIFLS